MNDILLPMSRLGDVMRQLAKYEDAEKVLTECLEMIKKKGSEGATGITSMHIETLYNIGTLHKERGVYNEAQEYYEQALGLSREFYTADDPRLAYVITGYAELLRKLGHANQAEK